MKSTWMFPTGAALACLLPTLYLSGSILHALPLVLLGSVFPVLWAACLWQSRRQGDAALWRVVVCWVMITVVETFVLLSMDGLKATVAEAFRNSPPGSRWWLPLVLAIFNSIVMPTLWAVVTHLLASVLMKPGTTPGRSKPLPSVVVRLGLALWMALGLTAGHGIYQALEVMSLEGFWSFRLAMSEWDLVFPSKFLASILTAIVATALLPIGKYSGKQIPTWGLTTIFGVTGVLGGSLGPLLYAVLSAIKTRSMHSLPLSPIDSITAELVTCFIVGAFLLILLKPLVNRPTTAGRAASTDALRPQASPPSR